MTRQAENEDSLFSDLGISSVVTLRGKVDTASQEVSEAWGLWAQVTGRPTDQPVDRKFLRLYLRLRKNNWSHNRLLSAVRAAAYLKPMDDANDVQRVISCLGDENVERAAAILGTQNAEIFPWPFKDELQLPQTISTLADVEKACGVYRRFWKEDDRQAAALLTEVMGPDELVEAADSVAIYMGEEKILPTELLRNASRWRQLGRKSTNRKSSGGGGTYRAGRSEQEWLEESDLWTDRDAEKLYQRGCPHSKVMDFHNEAPRGYWQFVAKYLEDNKEADYDDAYRAGQEKFGWNPSERKRPSSNN